MSIEATKWAWSQSVKPTSKLVLLSLADRANKNNECWPSIPRLVLNTGLDRKTIILSLTQLEEMTLINTFKKKGVGNKYHLNITDKTSTNIGTGSDINLHPEPVPKTALGSTKNGTTTSTKNGTQNLKEEPIINLSIKNMDEDNTAGIEEIFKFWQTTMNHPQSVFDTNRKSIIKNALKNYSIDQLKDAITGCAKSAWHMGQNQNGKIYNGLDLIFRNSEKIEGFIQNSTSIPNPDGVNKYATKRQQSANISEQIFSTTAQLFNPEPESSGGDGYLILPNDRYLSQPMD